MAKLDTKLDLKCFVTINVCKQSNLKWKRNMWPDINSP